MGEVHKVDVKRRMLRDLRVASVSTHVVVRMINQNTKKLTPSGIIMISDTDWDAAVHADRMGVVVSCPKRVPFKVRSDVFPWETKVQISEGMVVFVDYLASLNCTMFIDEDGDEYKLLRYDDINLAMTERLEGEDFDLQSTKDEKWWVIPVNGYSLFEPVYHERHRFSIDGHDKIDEGYGIVRYVAQNNLQYDSGIEFDHVKLNVGDKVRFNHIPANYLEDETYCSFDGGTMYRRAQARNIEMVWRGDELILPEGRVLLKQIKEEDVTSAGIILPKPDALIRNHRGICVVSSNGEIPIGSEIKYIKGAGVNIDYHGEEHRLVKSQEILYVN